MVLDISEVLMEMSIVETLKMDNIMEMECMLMGMAINILELLLKGGEKGKEKLCLVMEVHMRENF